MDSQKMAHCLINSFPCLFFVCFLKDYVDVDSPQALVKEEAEYHDAKSLQAASVTFKEENLI